MAKILIILIGCEGIEVMRAFQSALPWFSPECRDLPSRHFRESHSKYRPITQEAECSKKVCDGSPSEKKKSWNQDTITAVLTKWSWQPKGHCWVTRVQVEESWQRFIFLFFGGGLHLHCRAHGFFTLYTTDSKYQSWRPLNGVKWLTQRSTDRMPVTSTSAFVKFK